MNYSYEQLKIINSSYPEISVQAGAGAGKTTVLKGFCEARPEKRFLYLAFNSPIAREASEEFPDNVECLTFHALAMRRYGSKLRHKLDNSISVRDFLGLGSCSFEVAMKAFDLFQGFVISGKECIRDFASLDVDEEVLLLTEKAWKEMHDAKSEFPITQDGQLKYFILNFSLSDFDGVIVDEAQDSNDAKIDLIVRYAKDRKDGIRALVGDRKQQLNAWNGACDAMSRPEFSHYKKYTLIESYRFGTQVGHVANAILKRGSDASMSIIGKGAESEVYFCNRFSHRCGDSKEPVACLSRTIHGCIDLGLELYGKGMKIHWVGGIGSYRLSELNDLVLLRTNAEDGYQDPLFKKKWGCFNNYCYSAKRDSDEGRLRILKSLDLYPNAADILTALSEAAVDEEEADVVITTASRSKGRGWNYVYLNNDYPDICRSGLDDDWLEGELNILYVAVTRVKKKLFIANSHLTRYLAQYKEKMKKYY